MAGATDHSSAMAPLEALFVPLVMAAGLVGLVYPGPARIAVDHGAINATLVVLVLASATSVQAGAARRLRDSAGRLAAVLGFSTVALAASAWAVSHLVTDRVLRHGVLAVGVAPAEIAAVALTALAGGDVAVTAALLIGSTAVTVAIAGPVLALEAGGNVNAAGVIVDVALIVGLPMLVGLAGRPLVRRSRPLTAVLEPLPIIAVVVLVTLVAGQVHLARAYLGVTAALVTFIAASTAAGAVVARMAPPPQATAIVLSTSIRDFAIASGIATSAFGAEAAAPLGLYGVLVIGWGAVLARVTRKPRPVIFRTASKWRRRLLVIDLTTGERPATADPSQTKWTRLLLGGALTIGAVLFAIGTRGESQGQVATATTMSTTRSTTTSPASQPIPSSTAQTTEPTPSTTTRPPEGSPAREAQERQPTTAPATAIPSTAVPAAISSGTTSQPSTTVAAAEGTPAREAAEGGSGHVETAAERSSETVFGVNVESGGIVASVVILSIVLAGLVVLRRSKLALWVATGFCVLAAAADFHELRIQIDRSERGLALIAGTVAAVHMFGALVGLVAARQPGSTL